MPHPVGQPTPTPPAHAHHPAHAHGIQPAPIPDAQPAIAPTDGGTSPTVALDSSSVQAPTVTGRVPHQPVGDGPGAHKLRALHHKLAVKAASVTPDAAQLAPLSRKNVIGAPYINQMHPAGADASYTNGDHNCAPTCLAMVARANGIGAGLSDAQLISQIKDLAHTNGGGTSNADLTNAAQDLGLSMVAGPHGPTADHLDWTRQQLAQGQAVIVGGSPTIDSVAPTSGHDILVTGTDGHGNFVINNPGRPDGEQMVWSPDQLKAFIDKKVNHGVQGGGQFAVGPAGSP